MYLKNPESGQALGKCWPRSSKMSLVIFLVLCCLTWHSQFPRAVLSNKNTMQVTFVHLNILVTLFKKIKRDDNFDIFHLTRYAQNTSIWHIISIKIINEILCILLHAKSSKSFYIFDTYNTSQSGLITTFQRLSNHMERWLL